MPSTSFRPFAPSFLRVRVACRIARSFFPRPDACDRRRPTGAFFSDTDLLQFGNGAGVIQAAPAFQSPHLDRTVRKAGFDVR